MKKPCDITLNDVVEEGVDKMNIRVIVGNPPYQRESSGKAYNPPIYNEFMDFAFEAADTAMLITPARFLFNAGGTPADWNKKMLNDEHLKVIKYFPDSIKVFPSVDIKGGVVITKHDKNVVYEKIGTFYPYDELKSISNKANSNNTDSLNTIIANRGLYRFSKLAYSEYSDVMSHFSDPRIAPSSFSKGHELFHIDKPDDGHEYINMYGKDGQKRTNRYIRRDYVKDVENIDKYKVILPKANGAGTLGEAISQPVVGTPSMGYTETFVSIGNFDTLDEANACLKYIKTKFVRILLGILKVTQSNTRETWRFVPMQDFTDKSDIDWSQSIADIDNQLCLKYHLSDKEKDFIDKHAVSMQ